MRRRFAGFLALFMNQNQKVGGLALCYWRYRPSLTSQKLSGTKMSCKARRTDVLEQKFVKSQWRRCQGCKIMCRMGRMLINNVDFLFQSWARPSQWWSDEMSVLSLLTRFFIAAAVCSAKNRWMKFRSCILEDHRFLFLLFLVQVRVGTAGLDEFRHWLEVLIVGCCEFESFLGINDLCLLHFLKHNAFDHEACSVYEFRLNQSKSMGFGMVCQHVSAEWSFSPVDPSILEWSLHPGCATLLCKVAFGRTHLLQVVLFLQYMSEFLNKVTIPMVNYSSQFQAVFKSFQVRAFSGRPPHQVMSAGQRESLWSRSRTFHRIE